MNTKRPRITLATKVTLARFLGTPVFVLLMVYYGFSVKGGDANEYYRVGALVAFLGVALTDALDGYLARSRNEVTALGRILDPLADKTLLLSATIMLTRPSLPDPYPQLPIWFTVTVISRDALLIIGAMVVHHLAHAVRVHPRIAGKMTTVLQMTTVLLVLIQAGSAWTHWMAGVAALFTAISGAQYAADGIRQVEHAAHPAAGA
jgi:cardiolipin synthase